MRGAMALLAGVAGLWLTRALPLPVTALVVPVAAIAGGLATPAQALAPFANPVIFLFLGGFALAAALQQQGLDVALAARVKRLAGGRRLGSVLLLAGLTALLSMWMSNTATTAMVLPLALGLLADQGRDGGGGTIGERERVFVLLAVAYSASIGGMATLVGSPPNAIASAQAGIGFAQWLAYGLPAALLAWPLMLALLAWRLKPQLRGRLAVSPAPPEDRVTWVWTPGRRATVAVFLLTVAGWLLGAPLAGALGLNADTDALVALAALVALVASGALDWRALERSAPWGVLLLFGGGLSLSALMQASGASAHLAALLFDAVAGWPAWLLLTAVIAFVVFLTEIVSNTASAALLLPVLLPLAAELGLPAAGTAAAVALAASCAFMLPVATPPNALVYATDQVPAAQMLRQGLWLNGLAIGLITAMAGWLWT
ncbi:DASS family sodium-coupled anion symporter [Rubrivivax albus]|uniref:DASS family sodium-coupled anion symporter n=1 Tax=Rubrivivax albus TaxID=2499835 RepID=A0A437JT54_9BURK|nr:DASS family sodium-coupled anion symporter [Rubrivivax albus]